MPPVRTARNRKPPPAGFDDIEDTLLEFSNKMKDAENASHEGKKKYEVLWPIFQISHQRTCAPFPHLDGLLSCAEHPAGPFHTDVDVDLDVDLDVDANFLCLCGVRLTIHLRPLLRKRSHLKATLRLAIEE